MFYVISLTHTRKHSEYLCLWRPDNAGYCSSKESAGLYENPQKDYHDSESNMPVHEDTLNKYFIELPYDKETNLKMIPNCQAVWRALNLKMTKDGLRRISLS